MRKHTCVNHKQGPRPFHPNHLFLSPAEVAGDCRFRSLRARVPDFALMAHAGLGKSLVGPRPAGKIQKIA